MKLIKYSKFLFKIVFYLILIPFALLIIVLRPIIYFKFGIIRSRKYGSFISFITAYEVQKKRKKHTGNLTFNFLAYDDIVINKQLKKMFDRKHKTFSMLYFFKHIEKLLNYLTKSDSFSIQKRILSNPHDFKKLELENILSFNKEELEKGKLLTSQMGITDNTSIVCFNNRDSQHLRKVYPNQNWDHHDYRNFKVNSLLPAAEEFTKLNFYVVRYGSDAEERFTSKNKKIIDYPFSGSRSDFLDIYLAYKSEAYFGSTSGTSAIFQLFGKPTYCINNSLTLLDIHIQTHVGLFLTKHLYHKKKKQFIGLKQMFDLGINNFSRTEEFENSEITNISNSEEELKDFAIETISHLKGDTNLTTEDKKLQDRFWEIYFKNETQLNRDKLNIQISSSFLRKNRYLVD